MNELYLDKNFLIYQLLVVSEGHKLGLVDTDEYKKLNVPATGSDFFAESRRSIRKYVHPEDQEEITKLLFLPYFLYLMGFHLVP